MSFSPIQRLLRRVPVLRYALMRNARDIRKHRQDAAWEETKSVLIALGNITISWAGINLILNHFFEQYGLGGGAKRRKEIPISFTNKLDYMKEIEADPNFVPHALAEFRAVRLKLADLNKFRVNVVHGFLMRQGYGGTWKIHIAKETKDRINRWNVSHKTQDIHDFSSDLSAMGERLARLMPYSGNN